MVRVLAASTLFLRLLGVALAQDPPNHADSNVPYTLPTTAKYDYAEVIHKVSPLRLVRWRLRLLMQVTFRVCCFTMLSGRESWGRTVG